MDDIGIKPEARTPRRESSSRTPRKKAATPGKAGKGATTEGGRARAATVKASPPIVLGSPRSNSQNKLESMSPRGSRSPRRERAASYREQSGDF